ncbi:hypothetical protein [Bacillus pumilus]|uniref:hypothetical protein n=1 Tax=Bacillus pumilus TaxID=1408 RepID=UPI0011A1EBB3|nr:hypothetical protein [Bacillus pumilus]
MSEKKRRESKRGQVLNLLRRKGKDGATNGELSTVSLRYGGHLGRLYELGYKIKKEHLGDGVHLYTLIEEPSTEKREQKRALDVLIKAVEDEVSVDASLLREMIDDLGVSIRFKAGTHTAI